MKSLKGNNQEKKREQNKLLRMIFLIRCQSLLTGTAVKDLSRHFVETWNARLYADSGTTQIPKVKRLVISMSHYY